MMTFSRLKTWLILGTIALGALLCVPNLIPKESVPGWLPLRTIHLGLDLRGGAYLLLEVDMNTVVRDRLETLTDAVRTRMRTANVGYTGLAAEPAQRRVVFRLRDPAQGPTVVAALRELAEPIRTGMGQSAPDLEIAVQPDGLVSLTLTEVGLRERATAAVQQSIEIVRRRVDPDGTREASLVRQGSNRILLTLPGEQDPQAIKRLVGTTAKMTFHLLDESVAPGPGVTPPAGVLFLRGDGPRGADQLYPVRRRIEVDGANLSDARAGQNPQTGEWVVNFTFDSVGTRRFAEVTRGNVGRPFAIVLDDKVITAPVIREPITGGRGQISGSFTAASASELAVLLRAGALPAPLTVIEERTVGAELGADAIRAGVIALAVGFVLVCAFMVGLYGLFGLIAIAALVVNLVLLLAVLSLLEATLTLPGIAGILLTLGMAVDANILIIERIREEAKRGRSPLNAMQTGFDRAFATIVDSNLTTLLAMAMLYAFGSGPVSGFAVTISVGILTSMFTAVMLTSLMMVTWYRRVRPAALPV